VIAASAFTVILALFCLLAARANGTRGLGPVAASGIALSLLSALTLLPALLAICGRRIFWPFVPEYSGEAADEQGERRWTGTAGDDGDEHDERGARRWTATAGDDGDEHDERGARRWTRIANRVDRGHRSIALVATAALCVMCLGLLALNTGLTSGNSFRGNVESVAGQRTIAAHYPAGMSAPAQVVVPRGRSVAPVRAAVARAPGVAAVGPVQQGAASSVFTATLTANPSSAAAFDAIAPLRAAAKAAGGSRTLIGGPTAQEVDQRTAATRDTKLIVPMILLVVFAVLGLLLRSLVAPVLLIGTVLLSYGAALGVGAFLFEHAFGYPGEDPSLVLFTFLFLVALGVDYNIFLMARVREEALTLGTRRGVIRGLAMTGPVITSAGIVLAGTFAALASLPLIGLTQLGFVIAFGVLLDTLLVRTILVPALVIELDRRVWWPSKLARARSAGRLAPRGR
jgi:RND superfamily putative drug exporter